MTAGIGVQADRHRVLLACTLVIRLIVPVQQIVAIGGNHLHLALGVVLVLLALMWSAPSRRRAACAERSPDAERPSVSGIKLRGIGSSGSPATGTATRTTQGDHERWTKGRGPVVGLPAALGSVTVNQ